MNEPRNHSKNGPCCNNHDEEQAIWYRICVKGWLDPKWSLWFQGFTLIRHGENTMLVGKVPDQAALFGRLACIRDLGLTLISLQRFEHEPIIEE